MTYFIGLITKGVCFQHLSLLPPSPLVPAKPAAPPAPAAPSPATSTPLRHGFYTRQFKKADLADLEACQFSGLNDEITVMRVYLRRLIELGKDIDTYEDMLGLVRAMCLASTSITRLLRVQNIIVSPADERARLLDQTIAETLSELQARYGSQADPEVPQKPVESSESPGSYG